MINIDTHFFLEARHVDFMTMIKERSWFANATNHDAFRAVSNLLWGGSKWFFAARARAIYIKMHASAEWIKISSPEVKCCVKSREPEIKSAENICFWLEI